MKFYSIIILSALFTLSTLESQSQLTPYEVSEGKKTTTYEECIDYYRAMEYKYKCIQVKEVGSTDAGEPLHVILLSANKKFNPETWHKENKSVLLVNNGIHPGEPDGIDASMMWVRDLAENWSKDLPNGIPKNVCIAIIPIYNIGGSLNRSKFNRVDQNGPDEFGTRGNSQNLDLNRDFIKCDSREARTFSQLFQWLSPDIFIDNHVSDGADYPYTMTLATTQHNKLGGPMGQYLYQVFELALFDSMASKNLPMIPYVNVWGKDARQGWVQFFDSPRYSTGYTTLHHTFGFTAETHMLKPYMDRVKATYQFMQTMLSFAHKNTDTIKALRIHQLQYYNALTQIPIRWTIDESKVKWIDYNGYEYEARKSKVSNQMVHFYNKQKPYMGKVKFSNTYKTELEVTKPLAYVIPQGYWKVIELLQLNGVEMTSLEKDLTLQVEAYIIKSYKPSAQPYEGHHFNSDIQVELKTIQYNFRKGDMLIYLQQPNDRYIIETLEPQSHDSYFAWNFFDAILMQKEGYSDYAFEDYASDYLENNPGLKEKMEQKRNADSSFAHNASAQLEFVYKNSPYYEINHNLYPVFRIEKNRSFKPIKNHSTKEIKTNKHDE